MAEKKYVTLKLEEVSKSFAKVENDEVTHALNEVSLTMKSGEFISLVGPSGCGKSTILRLVAGLINPTTGKVTVDDKEILESSPERGMVFQKPTLFPWLTVEDNIAFSLKMQDEILKIWRERERLAIMVTHDVDEAIYMGTRVIVMDANPGRVVADIKISEEYPRDRSSASFVEYRNEILNRLHFSGKKQ